MTRTVETKVRVLRNGAQYSELQFAPKTAPRIRCRDSAEIKMSMTGEFVPNSKMDWLSDELQAVLIIDGVEHPVGTFLPASVEEKERNGNVTLSVEAYDRCWRVKTAVGSGVLQIAGNQTYIAAITSLLAGCGIVTIMATSSVASLPSARAWTPGTSVLTAVNEILAEINYKSLWFTAEGVAVLEPYAEPSAENIRHTLDGDDVRSLLLPEISRKTDIFDAPNTFVVICSNPDKSAPMTATAVNNSPGSPFSVIRRGRAISKVVQVKNISSQAALQEYADRLCNESMLRGETFKASTALLPGYGVDDVVALHYGEIAALCVDKEWSMDLRTGGTMTHTLEKVVRNIG